MDLVYFVVLVGVLVFVHELGHFAWAKFFGVKVLKFSLGFGPRLAGFRKGDTEYVVAAIPLGGYVKMLGESPADVVRPEEEEQAFHTQPLWKKIVIVVAGPAMNLVFPILLFFVVYLGDAAVRPPIVGVVFPDRPADGVLEPGDAIREVDGNEVHSYDDVIRIVADNAGRELPFVVDRDGEEMSVRITPVRTRVAREPRALDLYDEVGRVGIGNTHPTAVVGVSSPSSPAGAARMRTFDYVVSARGEPIDRWIDLEDVLENNQGSLVPMTYLRPQRVDDALGGLVELDVYEPHVAQLTPEPGEGSGVGRAGLEPADLYVSHVIVGSPEHRMGLLPGDRLVSLDGEPVRLWATFIEDLKAGRGEEHELVWRRGDRRMSGRYRLRHERGVDEHGQPYDRYVVGIRNWVPMRVDPGVDNPDPIAHAARRSVDSTVEMAEVTVVAVWRLLQGRLSVSTIGGPITIFDVAGKTAREGPRDYLRLMAFISINLGLINLLPIPLLDGGHLLFFLFEGVTRRRVSPKVRRYASLAGLVVLVTLMVLAFVNDIERQWPRVSEHIERSE